MAAGRSAVLTVRILSDATKVSGGLNSATAKFAAFGSKLGLKSDGFGMEAGGKLVSGFDKVLGTGLKIVGGAGAVVLGTALTKGFGRLKAIDNAQAKLKGLGHSAGTVETIMKNATASVKGTAYGLGDAATTAASVVAAGIQPGRELEGVLKTVADTATIAGTGMDEMGTIFSKVAAKNKVQADTLNQLTARGVPALQFLADHYGITAEKASEMVSRGQVDFQNFATAMEKGMGGAAKESGNTFEGAWNNTLAALGRIGEKLLSPLFTGAKDGLKGLPDLLAPVEQWAEKVGTAIGDMGKWISENTGLLKTLGTTAGIVFGGMLVIRAVVGAFQAYAAIMTVIKAAQAGYAAMQAGLTIGTAALTGATLAQKTAAFIGAAAQWALNSAMLASPITWIIIGIVALVAAFIILWNKCEGFRNFFKAMWEVIKTAAAAVADWFVAAWGAVVDWFSAAWTAVVNWFKGAWEGIKAAAAAVADWFSNAWGAVVDWFKSVWQGVQTFFTGLWEGIKTAIGAVANFFKSAWQTAVTIVQTIVNAFKTAFTAVFNAIRTVVSTVANFFKSAWQTAVNIVKTIINAVKTTFSNIFNGVRSIVQGVASWFGNVFSGPVNAIKGVINGIKGTFSSVFNAIKKPIDAVKGAFDGIVNAVRSVIDWIGKIKVPKFLSGLLGAKNAASVAAAAPAVYSPFATRAAPAVPQLLSSGRSLASSPQLARAILGGAGGRGPAVEVTNVYNIQGMDSGDTIARRIRSIGQGRDRRTGGIDLPRRVS